MWDCGVVRASRKNSGKISIDARCKAEEIENEGKSASKDGGDPIDARDSVGSSWIGVVVDDIEGYHGVFS